MAVNGPMNERDWVAKKDYFAILLVFLLLPIASQAGGLAVAAITSIGGGLALVGLGPSKIFSIIKNTPMAIWILMALLVWALVSSFWSPYISKRTLPNPAILLLGVPLYLLFARAVLNQLNHDTSLFRSVLIWGTIVSACAIFIDLFSGYAISLTVDPVSAAESFESRRGDMIQNLGHGVSVLALIFPVIGVLLWRRGKNGRLLAVILAAVIFVCAVKASVSASLLALVVAILFMLYAARRPQHAVKTAFLLLALSLILAPLFAFVATKLSADQLAALPFSWEERIHNWRYMYGKILESPFIGHGFDAVRTFQDTHTIRGYEGRAIVSLHPHNAGLHVWAELGLVGISISCAAIYFAYRTLKSSANLTLHRSVALTGVVVSALVISGFTYGVWQDWWWATVIICCVVVAVIDASNFERN